MSFVLVYLDYILVASTFKEEHLLQLRLLFGHLREHGLVIDPAKCLFGLSSMDFLGHHITPDGAMPLPSKVEAIRQLPHPTTVKALHEFLGMVNFYHRFIPRAARLMHLLYEALKAKNPQDIIS